MSYVTYSRLRIRDCLAAPGTTVADGAAPSGTGNPNKNKTCYKCQQEGHVRHTIIYTGSTLTTRPYRLPETALRTPTTALERFPPVSDTRAVLRTQREMFLPP